MTIKYIIPVIAVIFYLVVIIFAIKTKRPFFTLVFNALIGLFVFAIIDFTAVFTGVFLPINAYTVVGSGTFGIPAVICFLLLKIIFI